MDVKEIGAELETVLAQDFTRIIISNKSDKSYEYRRIEINKVTIGGKEKCQVSRYTEKQVFQDNINIEETATAIMVAFPQKLKQLNVFTDTKEISFKCSKSGKLLKNSRIVAGELKGGKKEASAQPPSHNRRKNYILQEGMVIPPLVDMGVFTKEGKVVASMYDKFKQINRFIELVDDVIKNHTKDTINIVDFGCGKSYLTFILYYYL